MKTIKLYILPILALFLITSCSRKMNFSHSEIVPAAQGSVKVKKDKNGNYALNVRLIHLAQPQQLRPPGNVYVVWMETPEHRNQNLGQLKSSSNFMNRSLSASLQTVTTFEPRRIFITAEDNGAISYPRGREVLSTSNF
jgi:hypothetical protein